MGAATMHAPNIGFGGFLMMGAMEAGQKFDRGFTRGFKDLKDTVTGEKARQKEQAEKEAALQADIERARAKFEAEHALWTLQMFVPETEHRFTLHFDEWNSDDDTRCPTLTGLYDQARETVEYFAPLLKFNFRKDAKLYFNDVLLDMEAKNEDGSSSKYQTLPAYCGMQDGDEVVLVLPPGFWATSALFEKVRDELRAANPCPEDEWLPFERDSYTSGQMFNSDLSIAKDCSITWNLSHLYLRRLVPSMAALKYGVIRPNEYTVRAGLDLRHNQLKQIPEYIRSLSPEESRDYRDQDNGGYPM